MMPSLNIGLHSQTLRESSGIISGSEVTTDGLASAFLKEKCGVFRFAPGKYNLIAANPLDLVIIEGWHLNLPEFIYLIRNYHPKAKILFWNLSFYGFNGVIKLDVDGFLSNSRKNVSLLNRFKPTIFLMLAADTNMFKFSDSEFPKQIDVVYLGMFHPKKEITFERLILQEASNFNLEIYGYGWETHPVLSAFAKGILPKDKMAGLYNNSKVVLGVTEDRQRRFGMINNRVYEALACGAFFISEYFAELEDEFGDMIFYSKKEGDTRMSIELILSNWHQMITHSQRVSSFIKDNHSYQHRIKEIMNFYQTLL